MPKYKKKRRSKLFAPPQRKAKTPNKRSKSEDIVMSPHNGATKKPKEEQSNMRVVKGRKAERKRKFKAFTSVAVLLIIAVLLFELFLPAGIIQSVSNVTALLGTGSYPIDTDGTKTLDVVAVNNYYFHLTDTHINGYSSAGKELFSEAHGFEKPLLSTSKGRALVLNQGGKQFHILDLKGIKNTVDTENEIICGSISDSGNFAVTTYSDKYASAVTVYNKRSKVVFEWYSAEETINNIAISPNGKKFAVSTFNSNSGVFNSKINIINFKSATPEFSKTFDNLLVLGLKGSNNGGFFVIKSKGTDFVKWNNYNITEYSNGYHISLFRDCGSNSVAVFCRENDKTDNKIVVLSKRGKEKHTVDFKGEIIDIRVKGSNIYCLGDTNVSVLNFDGAVKFTENYGFGGSGLVITSANTSVVIKDSEIIKIKLNEKE